MQSNQPPSLIADRFQIKSILGEGGMGIVYLAHDPVLNKDVAIKVLKEGMPASTIVRFQQEAKAVGKLKHSNIIEVYDFGISDDSPYLVMELLSGQSLAEFMKSPAWSQLKLTELIEILLQVARGLYHAHGNGILHRDIKPSNIMLRDNSDSADKFKVLLVDFGLAKVDVDKDEQSITSTGATIGSPLYMSPEQAEGEKIDHRTDIYSLACVLHESILGKPPFKGETPLETIMMHMSEPVKAFDETAPGVSVPPALEQVITKALAKKPAKRYQSINEFRDAVVEAMKTIAPVVPTAPGYSPVHGDNTDPNLRFASFSDHGDNSMNNPVLPSSTPPMKEKGKLSPVVIGVGASLVLAVCAAGALIGFNQISGSNPLIVSEQNDTEKKALKEAGDEKPKEKTKPVTTEAGDAGDADTQKEDRVIIDSIELKKIPSTQMLPLMSASNTLDWSLEFDGKLATNPPEPLLDEPGPASTPDKKQPPKCDIRIFAVSPTEATPYQAGIGVMHKYLQKEAQSWQELSVTFTNQKKYKDLLIQEVQYPRGESSKSNVKQFMVYFRSKGGRLIAIQFYPTRATYDEVMSMMDTLLPYIEGTIN
ncbi:MAG: serine/threonine protein kinase [Candidatus Obscuribacterales bacterium]|nr:serine/threonine protein kinase [Candidatus Obscuribacterales bacterium]